MYRKIEVDQIPQTYSDNRGKRIHTINWKNYTSLAGLVLLIIISSIMSPTFLSPFNIVNVASQIAAPGVLAIGMTLIILTAGIDLSVGSLIALTGVVLALATPVVGWPMALLLTIIVSITIGLLHGLVITKLNVPPFIVTLAGLTGYKGLALILTGAASVPIKESALNYLGAGRIDGMTSYIISIIISGLILVNYLRSFRKYEASEKIKKLVVNLVSIACLLFFGYLVFQVGGIPVQVLGFVLIFAVVWFVLNKTIFGREIYAIGGNPEAAKLAGVKVNRGLVIVYSIMGLLSAIAGIMVATRLGSGTPQVGNLGELDAIAAVVIGGTSLMGGVGKLGGTIIGVILIGILNNLLSLLNITADMQMIFKGAIILGAVILDGKLSKK
ncbi:sugar ABC transporter permease [Neobacillus sp. NPDC097160]|uniref:sugar ABC transporter permease n=1 Tax=Neobacillus sp. NPDC097160 TaxID=3364298 RepID=UPI00381E5234